MAHELVLEQLALGFPWKTFDPFLFCAHHDDHYPAGEADMGPPAVSLRGRNLGMDFTVREGWRMYHGQRVPGFPRHPHRGFETVTLARHGYIDHSDSLGATARFGHGDVQWMTAGEGIVHAEMFPLVEREEGNRTELFQLWLNLPKRSKMVAPHFKMFWGEQVPKLCCEDGGGKKTKLALIAGRLEDAQAPTPPPASWAHDAGNDVAIWTLKMDAGAQWTLPAASPGLNRTLYLFRGEPLEVGGVSMPAYSGARLRSDLPARLNNRGPEAELLMLQGRPMGEPVAQHGPFVMNSADEIRQAIVDYRRTGFGGWPWPKDDPVHAREKGRFALRADGREELPPRSPAD